MSRKKSNLLRRSKASVANGTKLRPLPKVATGTLPGFSTRGGWAAGLSGSGASGTMAGAVTGIAIPGGGGTTAKPQAPIQLSLGPVSLGADWAGAARISTAAKAQ